MERNTLLDALLDEAGMSYSGLAKRVNDRGKQSGKHLRYDHSSVIRWISKGQRPRSPAPELICEVMADQLERPVSLDDIGMGNPGAAQQPSTPLHGFINRSTALWRGDFQQRKDVESAPVITGLPAVGPVWEWENPPDDTDVSRRGTPQVGADDVGVLRTARGHYEQMYRTTGGVTTKTRVVHFLNQEVAPLLRGAYTDPVGRELHRAAGGLAAVAGICSYDADAQGLAQRYFYQALRLAKASGDRGFGGYVIALLVNQSLYLHEYRQAVAFAEAGLRTAGAHITHALATDLYAMQAKAFARMGDQNGAHRCMTLAEQAVGRIRRDEEPAETGYVQPGLVEVQFAEALMSLGDMGPAQKFAREAVRAQAHTRGRVHRLATLTNVDLRKGDAEQAAATAMEMVGTAQGIESQRLRDRFRSVRQTLAEHGNTATAEAAEQIDDALRFPL
ncbi:transcriptional regulator [Streptomyces boninensis]|uniref:transcriptional regulator n=1 Tax=Streptomyces boninensis TaxID=2039455 RepID=UPI003B22317D